MEKGNVISAETGLPSTWWWRFSHSVVFDSYNAMNRSPSGSFVHGLLQARILEWGAISPFQGILPTQGLNPTGPHCRQTLLLLNYQGSPLFCLGVIFMCFFSGQWQPTPVLLPGKSHERRSLVGFSPWGCKELDMTEQLHFTFFSGQAWFGHLFLCGQQKRVRQTERQAVLRAASWLLLLRKPSL